MNKLLTLAFLVGTFGAWAQDDLMKELEKEQKPETNYATQTFKGTRIINGQTVEAKGKGELEFIFAHRFGLLNSGSYHGYGFDDGAIVRLGLEYGITDRLGVGLGRNFYFNNKLVDLYLRYKIARQCNGAQNFPVTITAIGSMTYQGYPNAADAGSSPVPSTTDRIGYVLEVPIARKFSSKFSVQVTPIFVHRNAVIQAAENNDDYAVAISTRYRLTRSFSVIAQYYNRLNPHSDSPLIPNRYNAAGLGFDIETGGHNFQMVFTNSAGLNPQTTVTQTDGNLNKGDVRFGFNITRTFQVSKRQK